MIKDKCVACGHTIIRNDFLNKRTKKDYYNQYGNYCMACCKKAGERTTTDRKKTKDELLQERKNKLITEWGGYTNTFKR